MLPKQQKHKQLIPFYLQLRIPQTETSATRPSASKGHIPNHSIFYQYIRDQSTALFIFKPHQL